MPDCVFCKIVSGQISSYKVYENETTYAFLDITPINPGHTLVIPKKHAADVFEIEESEWQAVMKTARLIAHSLQKALGAEGVNIDTNNRAAAGQVVFHSHVHVIPRFLNDGFVHWKGTPYADGVIETIAEKIRVSL